MNLKSCSGCLDRFLTVLGSWLQSPLLLAIRLYWGWHFVLTGWGKLHDLGKVTGYFQSLNIPAPHLNAIAASLTECTGGLLLLLGLFTRFACVPLAVLLSVAYLTADADALRMAFSNPDKFFAADEFLFLYAVVIVFCFGPGAISLDRLFFKKK
jgi:putative oxidoreductase